MILALALILVTGQSSHCNFVSSKSSELPAVNFHVASANLSEALNAGSTSAAYDEQLGITFTQSFSNLAYNVTAIAQTDSDGYGPAYLLNGLTNAGYWYQIGVSYNWPELSGQHVSGFSVNYNVFNNKQQVVLPASGAGGVTTTTGGSISQGDDVGLSLSFSGANVLMLVHDWTSGATAQVSYNSEAATQFVGLTAPANSNGFFTGLMTEQYHNNPYTGDEAKVHYSSSTITLSSAILWIDEYNVNTLKSQFGNDSGIISFAQNPTQYHTYSLNGGTVAANAANFITGSENTVQFILDYSIAGGGTGLAPIFSYTSHGITQTATLTTSQVAYSVDNGTSWSVTNLLADSSSNERWITNQSVSGIALSDQTFNFLYFHQYAIEFSYVVIGAGSGFNTPAVTAFQFGSRILPTMGQETWVDSGTQYSFTNPLIGSTLSERWQAASSSVGEIASSGIISPQYYHQFSVNAVFSVSNSGLPTSEPMLTLTTFGTTQSPNLALTPVSYWADAGSSYNATGIISGLQERWITNATTKGTVSTELSLNFPFDHQYYFTMETPVEGGSVNPTSEWVNQGDGVSISNSALQGWKFEFWRGTGTGAYSGNLNTTTIMISGPVTENATFYVGLTIGTSSGGSVSYSYGNTGSVHVTTQSGIYVPPGTLVTFKANPSPFLYRFASWSGSVNGSSAYASVMVSSPSTVEAHFGYNEVNIGEAAALVIIVSAALIVARRRSG
ncbi:MAG: hypothetical protein JRN67_06235 [Nitrososphaerota archaeon]|nr:hypothetical protein [Nitrososphaerota archaeon]